MVDISAFDGQIYGLDAASGEEVWNLRTARNSHMNSMSLVSDGRRLVFATRGGFRPPATSRRPHKKSCKTVG
jgi:hypothetical protein